VPLGAVANDTAEEESRCWVSCSVVTPSDPRGGHGRLAT
jgi:hypothetical protein